MVTMMIPSRRHASDTQCTAKASFSSSPSSRTAKRTNTSSRISPNTWNGRLSISSHIGLNPLFLTVLVRFDTCSADDDDEDDVLEGGDEQRPQSGKCTETSTYGFRAGLSTISRPFASLGSGSCCAEITWTINSILIRIQGHG